MSRNIVFVSLAYRQSFFAVPNLNHKLNLSIDLNCGFHDIIHGIKWVKNEIHAFGGNPNRLTVMGDSGGASNIRVLLMSPLSKHLINQAVICSVASDFIFVRDKNENSSRILAKIVGCTNLHPNNSEWENIKVVEKIIKCLRLKPAKELSDAQVIIESMGYEFKFIARDFGPNAIAPRSYDEMLNETVSIPILSGAVAKEFLHSKNTIIKFPNGTFAINKTELHIWSKRALEDFHFLNPKPKTIAFTENEYNSIPKSAFIYDDVETFVPTYDFAVNQVHRGSNVFLYEYIYQDVGDAYDSGPKKIPRIDSPKHAQELSYLLGLHIGNFTDKDIQIRYLYSQIFVDFINYGTPNTATRKWKKFDPLKSNYFVIDFPDPDLKCPGERNGYHSEAVKFWDTVVPRLEGPKTEIVSETQITYDPYVEKKTIKRNSSILPTILLMSQIPSESQKPYFNWGYISWAIFVTIFMLGFIQIIMFLKLSMKRRPYQKLVN
uniref:Carboxylic ester hydrolase n=1 Tax=Panagrolaimus superbus TaxID=310955 RepID=A0A914ZAS8_9BILA